MRLNNNIRQKVQKALIDRAFSDRRKELEKREAELALALYRSCVPKHLEAQIDKLNRDTEKAGIKGSFSSYTGSVEAKCIGMRNRTLTLLHRRPWICAWNSPRIHLVDDHPHREEFEKFCADEAALKTEVQEAEAQIKATLARINTEKQFEETWPAALAVAKPLFAAPTSAPVPAIATDELNAKLLLHGKAAA